MKLQRRSSLPAPASRQTGPLREAFRITVEALKRRRADLLAPAAIDAYVEFDWLIWSGGSLKLTTVGENIYSQLRKERIALSGA